MEERVNKALATPTSLKATLNVGVARNRKPKAELLQSAKRAKGKRKVTCWQEEEGKADKFPMAGVRHVTFLRKRKNDKIKSRICIC